MSAPKVLIPFYSRSGTIEAPGPEAVAEGARGRGRRSAPAPGPRTGRPDAMILSSVPGWKESAEADALNAQYPAPTSADDAEWADAA